ncbi:MAG: hypothetical protein WC624_06615 [Candidatus Margulisiibacteriota bacterium]
MKKLVLVCLAVLLMVSVSNAQMIIGARAAGMGGAGVAAARDLSAAYYNPAALMKASRMGFLASVNYPTGGFDQLTNLAAQSGDPAKFANDNFAKEININTGINGIIGGCFNKVGVSVIPGLTVNLNKPASSLGAVGGAVGSYTGILTAGYSWGLMGLPSIDIGANLKALGGISGNVNVTANPLTGATGNQSVLNSSGVGLDLGALMTFDIPMVTSLSVGLVARDLAETITTTGKTRTLTAPAGSNTLTQGPETDIPSTSQTTNATYVLGASGSIPGIGAVLAGDIESGNGFSNTHIGIEYPVMLKMLTLRAGLASGTNLSLTTIGANIGIPFLALNLAYVMDGKISNNNSIVFDIAGGI